MIPPVRFYVRSDGALEVPSDQLLALKRLRMSCEHLCITIEGEYRKRTLDQNALYQTLVKELCIQFGYSSKSEVEAMKSMVKQRAVYLGYPCEKDEFGLDMFVGDSPVPKSSADVSVEEFEYLIEACYLIADEENIKLKTRR